MQLLWMQENLNMSERIQKYLSRQGVGSRRYIEGLVKEGYHCL